MLKKIKNAFQRMSSKTSDMEDEYIKYTQEVEHTLCLLEDYLHKSDDSAAVLHGVLKIACDFYQADWGGFLEMDMELGLWTPSVWYKADGDDKTTVLLEEFESSEFLTRWVHAMQENSAISIQSIDELANPLPEELNLYKHLAITSLLAVPLKPRPTGFLLVKNPQRYAERSSMLQMIGYVFMSAYNEQKMLQSLKMIPSLESIKQDTDVVINVFGNLEIYTSNGVLREADLKSPKICRLLVYMILNRKSMIPAREIAEAIWPDEVLESDNPGKNLRALIFRLRQAYSLISDYTLIETTPNGYRINPKLHVMTDLQLFEKDWGMAQRSNYVADKVDILKQAVNLYKGEVLASASGEHWLLPTSSHYSLMYIGIMEELLKTLSEQKDFHNLHRYAAQALAIDAGHMRAHYWLIYSMMKMGASELARTQLQIAQKNLLEEEYKALVLALDEDNISPSDSLFRNEKIQR